MKLFGYTSKDYEEMIAPTELAEITLAATPEELRRIANFLQSCAEGIEKRGMQWEHEHLSDKDLLFRESPQLIVFNSNAM